MAREAPADEADAAEAGAFGRIEEGTLTDYALALIRGVEANQAQVDERIEAASENWALSRMPIVDRSILRLAVFEMFHCDDVPVSVSINEAVELAKGFGGEDDSPRFVNGVLGRIARSMEGGGVGAMADEQGRTFEDVHERLSEIVDEVSAEDISLDDALKLYEEAVKLGLSACDLSEQDLDAFLATEEETTVEEGGASATPTGSTDMPREA